MKATEPTSGEKNEAVARWMGWRWFSETTDESRTGPDFPVVPDEKSRIGWRAAPIPAYGESLDALVPVMEALVDYGLYASTGFIDLLEGGNTGFAVIRKTSSLWVVANEKASTPAEALRDAIYAALVALGEVTE